MSWDRKFIDCYNNDEELFNKFKEENNIVAWTKCNGVDSSIRIRDINWKR